MLSSAFSILDIIHHATVREIMRSHSNILTGIILSILQMCILIGMFFAMGQVMGFGTGSIRGDLLIYLMTGVFLFSVHSRSVAGVLASEGPSSPMMVHQNMTGLISVSAASLAPLYTQTISAGIILLAYHWAWEPIMIHQVFGSLAMYLLSWISGVGVGMALLPLKPRFPEATSLISQLYSRVSMIGSGQMFVANSLPGFLIPWFDWNPLFHVIDQARGFAFINYTPWYSNLTYPILSVSLVTILAILLETHLRKNVSVSWFARR